MVKSRSRGGSRPASPPRPKVALARDPDQTIVLPPVLVRALFVLPFVGGLVVSRIDADETSRRAGNAWDSSEWAWRRPRRWQAVEVGPTGGSGPAGCPSAG